MAEQIIQQGCRTMPQSCNYSITCWLGGTINPYRRLLSRRADFMHTELHLHNRLQRVQLVPSSHLRVAFNPTYVFIAIIHDNSTILLESDAPITLDCRPLHLATVPKVQPAQTTTTCSMLWIQACRPDSAWRCVYLCRSRSAGPSIRTSQFTCRDSQKSPMASFTGSPR